MHRHTVNPESENPWPLCCAECVIRSEFSASIRFIRIALIITMNWNTHKVYSMDSIFGATNSTEKFSSKSIECFDFVCPPIHPFELNIVFGTFKFAIGKHNNCTNSVELPKLLEVLSVLSLQFPTNQNTNEFLAWTTAKIITLMKYFFYDFYHTFLKLFE